MQIIKEYKAGDYAGFTDAEAQKYGECLDRLQEKHGTLQPPLVVKEASKKSSPLHDYFEWDDTVAAAAHREYQARKLINHIEVRFIRDDNKKGTIRRYHNVIVSREDSITRGKGSVTRGKGGITRGYVNLDSIVSNQDYQDQIVERALEELKAWKGRYEQYKKLTPIIRAIEKAESRVA